MKRKHKLKRLKASRRFATRSTKRIASTALAAATIGTVAVVVTMASFEFYDYCEEKKDFQEDTNMLNGTNEEFNYEQCIEEGYDDSKVLMAELKNYSAESVSSVFNTNMQYSGEKWDAIKEASVQALESTGETAGEIWDATKYWLVE